MTNSRNNSKPSPRRTGRDRSPFESVKTPTARSRARQNDRKNAPNTPNSTVQSAARTPNSAEAKLQAAMLQHGVSDAPDHQIATNLPPDDTHSGTETTENAAPSWQQVTWFAVNEHQDGQRLDNFLVTRLKGVPKTRIYRLIREGEVRVNKGRVRADTRLQVGDQVRVAPIRRNVYQEKAEIVIGDDLAASLVARIVYEDDGLMVINKPAGLAVHGGSGVAFGVIEAVRQAQNKPYLELVHRIDRDTSGLLMIAKKRSVLKKLQDDLRDGRIRKTYFAILKGRVLLDQQSTDLPLLRYELPNGERRVRVSPEGKDSKTNWLVIERFASATLVEASPLTGRTHQIRVHGLAMGHALVGDDKYGHERPYRGAPARRLCLHAARLNIPNYPLIEAPMAEDMAELLQKLREGTQ